MECACIVDADIGDGSYDNLVIRHTVSKRDRKCIECEQPIKAGIKHLHEVIQWEERKSSIESYRTCADCESLRDVLCCDWCYGMVLEDINNALDYMDDYPWAAFAKLTPSARDYVLEIIEDTWIRDDD